MPSGLWFQCVRRKCGAEKTRRPIAKTLSWVSLIQSLSQGAPSLLSRDLSRWGGSRGEDGERSGRYGSGGGQGSRVEDGETNGEDEGVEGRMGAAEGRMASLGEDQGGEWRRGEQREEWRAQARLP